MEGQLIKMFDGSRWVIKNGNVYDEGDVGRISFKGHFSHDFIVSMDGKCLFTVGEPYSE